MQACWVLNPGKYTQDSENVQDIWATGIYHFGVVPRMVEKRGRDFTSASGVLARKET